MIRLTQGDLFRSKAQTLVNAVNCVGVMGKGLAKEFRDRWPGMFREYAAACRRGEVRSGKPFLYRERASQILCFPTKDHWKDPSRYELIEEGLRAIRDHYREWEIRSLALPALGCGLGGLEWEKVRVLMEKHLKDLQIDIEVYAPSDADLMVDRPKNRLSLP